MILVIGGTCSGKTDYVRSLGYSDDMMADGTLGERPVLLNLEKLIAQDVEADLLPQLVEKDVVTCAELGCGIVPMSPDDRGLREATGRLCVFLAKEADQVVRMVAGIPQVIKG